MNRAVDAFDKAMADNKAGQRAGVYSVCSAHPLVLEAALKRARTEAVVVIESTSNQVDQFGGYTGMKPADFARWVFGMADALGVSRDRILLGGDHLGPNAWRSLPEAEAMARSEVLVHDYVAAGYRKIHLDCSMALADDTVAPGLPLPDELVARRAARLCAVAEGALPEAQRAELRYVIGTEVPIPGGAQHHEDSLECTSVEAARATIDVTRRTFEAHGLADAWKRVSAAVVQPGVEFGDDFVLAFHPEAAGDLSRFIGGAGWLVFEAHSTDYQTQAHLDALVTGHFGILKVGPWLTFALREALFSLAALEDELVRLGRLTRASGLRAVVAAAMTREPKFWKAYYSGDVEFKKTYSYSDRIRYYWAFPEVEAAVQTLLGQLDTVDLSAALVGQYFSDALPAMKPGVAVRSRDLVLYRIDRVLALYAHACGAA
jgi:D-tagatose-1,6-bisphosphate aldolase subunit GatZ/KbaZ